LINSRARLDWLPDAVQVLSPNANARPQDTSINLLVIHSISLPPGEFGTGCVQQFFQNQLNPQDHAYFETIAGLKVSSHVYVERTGVVTQFVPFSARAWHAGVSVFNGIENCNDYSIGIELEGCDDIAYTDEQYAALVKIIHQLQVEYPAITPERIVGHCDIAPARKTDPGAAFDWPRLLSALSQS
jgi:AmpD protein